MKTRCLLLLLMLGMLVGIVVPSSVLAQSELLNGNLIIAGHINTCTDSGTVNAYSCTLDRTLTQYEIKTCYGFLANSSNTGSATVNFSSVGGSPMGAKTIVKMAGGITTALVANDIRTGQIVHVCYDGTNMQMMSQTGNAGGTGGVNAGTANAATFYATAGTNVDPSTGLKLNATTVLTRKDAVTAVSVNTILSDHNIIYCSPGATDKTLTLPAASATSVGYYRVIKADSGVGACVIIPNGSDTLNGVPGNRSITTQWGQADITLMTTTSPGNWYVIDAGPSESILSQSAAYQVTSSDFDVGRAFVVPANTFTITLVASGVTQPANGKSIVVLNYGSGVVTIARSGQNINGVAANLTLPAGTASAPTSVKIWSDGTNYFAALSGVSSTPALVRSIYIPAGGLDTEGLCSLGGSAALVTNGPRLPAMTCTDVDTDGIDFDVVMPDSWNAGTVTVELDIFYTGTTHDTQVFDMNFSGQCVRNGDTVAAFAITSGATAESSTNVEVQFTAADFTTSGNLELKKASSAITLSGTCAGGAHVYMHGLVDATSTTFTPMTELKILGVKLEYTSTGSD